ncbi:hypothetical protein PRZ48_006099 [Zasmidium cellare]|uniref:FAD-binding domain-containing protein n=1 Tax=Zasmidium cellare TaxID=395010 RepID=A0ABR0EPD8_ZASCE|nr:hypothetical protein PRZ48_006099 [Zasmidium cellare]
MAANQEDGNTGLSVIIVGGGIAGLAAATSLAQKHHTVTILESAPSLNKFGASIGILANGVRPLKAWGLGDAFDKMVTKNRFLEFRNGYTNEYLGHTPHNEKGFSISNYGEEIWNINRVDYQQVLAQAAEANGARIVFNARVESVDVENCVVECVDGREFKGDVIIGADGNSSVVRGSIPATKNVKPRPWEEQAFRCTVPKEKMRGNPELEWLLSVGNEFVWSGEGKYILTWPLPDHRHYDVVCAIQRPSDVPAGRWGMRADPEEARKGFEDFCPVMRALLKHIETAVKWTLCDLPPLETCRSGNGRVVLIGDAFHAMIPHSASGGNSSIEDAACIAECLDWAYRNNKPISLATQAFEHLRKPRVERMQEASRESALKEGTKLFDAALEVPEEERKKAPKPEKDMHERFPLPGYVQWLWEYDAIEVAREYLATLG